MKLIDYGGENMIGDFFLALGKGVGMLFVQPFFYVYFLLIIWLGSRRVKRERKYFSYRIFDSLEELRQSLKPGLLAGFILSLLFLAAGIVLSKSALLLLTIVMLAASIIFPLTLLNPSVVFGLVAFFMLAFPNLQARLHMAWDEKTGAVVFLIGSILVFVEGILIYSARNGSSTPLILEGNRGKKVGAHLFQRAWLLPVCFFLPGGTFSAAFAFWPVFSFGETQFDIILFPVGICFMHVVQTALPIQKIPVIAKQIMLMALAAFVLGIIGIFVPIVAVIGAVLLSIGRLFLLFQAKRKESENNKFFMPAEDGVIILSVIPKSLAERMSLQIGEKIVKVNGHLIVDEKSFYEALEKNRALCKLEVIDLQGEIRIIQKATYTDDHHELGVILA